MFVEIHSHLLMFVHESKSVDNRVNWFSVIKVSIIHNNTFSLVLQYYQRQVRTVQH